MAINARTSSDGSLYLLDLEALLSVTLALGFCALGFLRDRTGTAWRIDHVHIGHFGSLCSARKVEGWRLMLEQRMLVT